MRCLSIEHEHEIILRLIQAPQLWHDLLKVYYEAERNVKTAQAIHFEDEGFPVHGHIDGGFHSSIDVRVAMIIKV